MTLDPASVQDDRWNERTAPWLGANEKLIRYAHRPMFYLQAWSYVPATGHTESIPMDVTSASLTLDAGWSPYMQGTAVIRRPDAATLARLDPRQKVNIRVAAGYFLPGSINDRHEFATGLWLSRRTRNIAEDTVTLEFQGGEYLVDSLVTTADMDGPQDLRGGWTDTTAAYLAIGDVLDYTGALAMTGGDWIVLGTATEQAGWVPPGDPWTGRAGDNCLDLAREVATRNNLWFRCDETGDWKLTPYDTTSTAYTHELRDGADGTIIEATHDLSREEWANQVTVVHNWSKLSTSGATKNTMVDYSTSGTASISTGPYSVDAAGPVAVYVERDTPSSFALTQIEAANILGTYQRNAGTYAVDSIAAYWLRPGHNVRVSVNGEAPTLHGVQSVTFDFGAGRMTTRLRQPGTPETIVTG